MNDFISRRDKQRSVMTGQTPPLAASLAHWRASLAWVSAQRLV